jgi:hypothetical protein
MTLRRNMKRAIPILSCIALLSGCGLRGQGKPTALPPSVQCVAELTGFVKESPWFENWVDGDGNANHCDGVAPSATLRITSPESYSGRLFTVSFRFPGEGVPESPSSSPPGTLFKIELPSDFLKGDYPSIYDRDVKNIERMP